MTWMNKAAGDFPLYLSGARGSRVTDIDGREYIDFALGDTGAMAGIRRSRSSPRSGGGCRSTAASRR